MNKSLIKMLFGKLEQNDFFEKLKQFLIGTKSENYHQSISFIVSNNGLKKEIFN